MRNMLPSPSASPSSLAVSVGLSPSIVTWSPARHRRVAAIGPLPLCASAFLFRIQAEPLQTCLYLSSYKARTSPSGIALLGGPSQPLLTPGSFLVVGLVLLIVHPCWELPGSGLGFCDRLCPWRPHHLDLLLPQAWPRDHVHLQRGHCNRRLCVSVPDFPWRTSTFLYKMFHHQQELLPQTNPEHSIATILLARGTHLTLTSHSHRQFYWNNKVFCFFSKLLPSSLW